MLKVVLTTMDEVPFMNALENNNGYILHNFNFKSLTEIYSV